MTWFPNGTTRSAIDRTHALRDEVADRLSGSLVSNPALAEELNRQIDDLVQPHAPDAPARGRRTAAWPSWSASARTPPSSSARSISRRACADDENVNSERIVAVGDLYYIYQHEPIGVFRVVQKLKQLFEGGAVRLSGGDGRLRLYQFDRRDVLRYTRNDRVAAYRRVLGYGRGLGAAQAAQHRLPHALSRHFVNQVTLFWRDKRISDVIRERAGPELRSIAVVRRAGLDLRNNLKFTSFGHLNVLRVEVMQLLEECFRILGAEDVKELFGADNAWDVVDEVLIRYFDERLQSSPRQRMASPGARSCAGCPDAHHGDRTWAVRGAADGIAEPAEEWLTSAQAMSLARRTGTDRVLPWEPLGQAGIAGGTTSGSPRRCRPPRAARPGLPAARRPGVLPRRPGRSARPSASVRGGPLRGARRRPAAAGGPADRVACLARDSVRQRRPGACRGRRPRGSVARVVAARPRREHGRSGRPPASRTSSSDTGPPGRAAGGDLRPPRRAACRAGVVVGPFYARGPRRRALRPQHGDDKGQLFAHLCALDAWRQAGILPVQVLVIAEGAEEVGSPGFAAVLRQRARRVPPEGRGHFRHRAGHRRHAHRNREPARPPRRPA